MHELWAVAVITILAVISPGPDFAMVTRNSYAFGKSAGLFCALGIGFGVQVHVIYTVFGISAVILQSPGWFWVLKSTGAAYLVWMGYQSWRSHPLPKPNGTENNAMPERKPSPWNAFCMGFFTNALNPKTMLFVVATYTQVVRADAPLALHFAYGLFMSLAHVLWFAAVAVFFAHPAMRDRLLARQKGVDRAIGLTLMLLGGWLLWTA